MKPTQEQILSAINELITEKKTSLMIDKVEKVELAAIDDLRKNIEKSYKLFTEADKIIQNNDKKINNLFEKAKKLRGTLNNNLKVVEKDAKELGVIYTDVPAVEQYFKADTILSDLIKKLIERRK